MQGEHALLTAQVAALAAPPAWQTSGFDEGKQCKDHTLFTFCLAHVQSSLQMHLEDPPAQPEEAQLGKTQTGKTQAGNRRAGKAQTGKRRAGKAQRGKAQTGKTQAGKGHAGRGKAGKTWTGKERAEEA